MVKRYKQNEIDELVEILKRDGVISVPTDTVYGVCARISSKDAYEKLVQVKNRPAEKAFPVMCANENQIRDIAIIDENAQKIINAFMPGPITIVLRKNNNLPEYVTNGKDTIAVRMATSKLLEELIIKVGSPIFMTSANQSGMPTCTNLEEIEKFCPLLDGMTEGEIVFSQSSTIIDCSSEKMKIIRQGPITEKQISDVIG